MAGSVEQFTMQQYLVLFARRVLDGMVDAIEELDHDELHFRPSELPNSIGRPTDFFVACAANPTADDVELELRRVREKLDAGADVLMTQPVYDTRTIVDFFERLGPFEAPVLLGIMPLVSYRNAEFVHNELAGVSVPDGIRARMRAAGEAGADIGVEIALEQIEETREMSFVSGIYVMPAFGRYEIAAEVTRRVLGSA